LTAGKDAGVENPWVDRGFDTVAETRIRTITAPTRLQDRLATNFLGELAVAKVVIRAIEKGITPLRPLVECRYDLVLDDGFKLDRVQVKYAGARACSHASGVVPVSLAKWRTGGRRSIPYYRPEEVDAVLVYVRAIEKILWFGPEVFEGRMSLSIRIEPARNGQQKGCLMAADYVW
jgi:hypothetical protein